MQRWTAADVPPQDGRTVIVTGANSGLGRATSKVLARAGAKVVMAVRDVTRGRDVAREIGGQVEVRQLDLANLRSVREFADGWQEPVDVLINNAGVMAVPDRQETVDGFELQFGTNHLGHFALTNVLLPHLTDRVVTVSSGGHRMGTIVSDDLDWRRRRYRRWGAYGQSKLANLLFTLELQRRLADGGSQVKAMAAHPGLALTNLYRPGNPIMQRVGPVGMRFLAQTEDAGALPILFAATQDLPGASYVGPDGPGELRGAPTLVGRSRAASDPQLARDLWVASERLTGIDFPL
ncbi:MAG TPA: oxidoreductase [Propionibacteriaceae bacterium]|nr:oxidoreductase [Propionibacteriaceae bacterium]